MERKPRQAHRVFALAALMLGVAGCGGGSGSAVQVQVCVENRAGVVRLHEILSSAAGDAGLPFIDYSDERPNELRAVGHSLDYLDNPNDYFEVWGSGGFGAGFSATNAGLSSFEISIAFIGGDDAQAEVERLAQEVVSQLSMHWTVLLVPPDRGALPVGNCPAAEGSTAPVE